MKKDFVYVNCDNGPAVPMRPVKWDKRIAGNPNTLIDGGKKDMVHVVKPHNTYMQEPTFPVAISVMGDIWELQMSWDAECERIEIEARIDAAARRDAEAADQEEIDAYAEYDMSLYIKA